MLNPVAVTGLLVAALRAAEANQAKPLFHDPFAARLAGAEGRAALEQYRAAIGAGIPIIEVRTRYFDEAILRAQQAGARQFVILAAGMDARAYRLAFRKDARVFEIDQPAVLAHKHSALADATPRCTRCPLPMNLAHDWPARLREAGFDTATPSVWLIEGLLQYLDLALVHELFARIDGLAAAGSTLLYDVVGEALLKAPMLEPLRRYMRENGAPWTFASDEPTALLGPSWSSVISDPAQLGNAWGRWPFPVPPADAPSRVAASGYLIEATKRA